MYALQGAQTVADLKAISQNLMHSSLTITDQVYGVLTASDVGARITSVSAGKIMPAESEDDLLDRLAERLLNRLEARK